MSLKEMNIFGNPNISKMDNSKLKIILDYLNKRLKEENILLDINIYGGGSMLLLYEDRIATRDIDCVFKVSDSMIFAVILKEIKEKFNLDRDWFNSEVKNPLEKLSRQEIVNYKNYSNMRIKLASKKQLLAMKVLAARPEPSNDFEDALMLCRDLKLKTKNDILDIVKSFLSNKLIKNKNICFLEQLEEELNEHSR